MNQIVTQATPQFFLDVRANVDAQVTEAMASAQAARDEAVEMIVDDDAMLDIASNALRDLATANKKLDERRKEFTRPLDEQKTYIMDVFKGPQSLVEEGEKSLRGKVQSYMAAKQAEADQQRREIEAREKQEREAAAERQYKAEQEARELAEKAAAATSKAAKARIEAQAQEAARRAEDAAAAVELSTYAPSGTIAVQTAKPTGVGTRGKWKVQSIELLELVKAAAAEPDKWLMYLEANEKRLGQVATMLGADARVPGVTFHKDQVLAVRSR
jgi:hypothetical protein